VIDHHLTHDGFGDEVLVSPDAASTTQLVYHVLVELGWPVSEPVAAALYTGLVTDTGRFQYSSTSPEVHRIAAELLGTGLDSAEIGRHLYEEVPFGYLEVASQVLGRAALDTEAGLVWSVLLRSDLAGAGLGYEEADALIDLVRIAEEAEVACLLKELGPDRFKGSLRSRGVVDVAAIAAGFGGGGHHNAAGFTHTGSAEDAITRILEGLR
jgi:phosphoesterase RecJ-like protein